MVRLVHFGLTWLQNLLNNVLLELLSYSNYSCSRDLSFSLFQLSSRSADCHCNLFHVLVILYLFFTMESIGNFWTIVLSLELLYPTIKLSFLTLSIGRDVLPWRRTDHWWRKRNQVSRDNETCGESFGEIQQRSETFGTVRRTQKKHSEIREKRSTENAYWKTLETSSS